jgi:transcription initiation factor TFIIIB Brf1 subunit/transcription initiation factor TFIIB
MMATEGEYVCATCGEVIVIPVDPAAGNHQVYVEDCPVCCHAHTLTVVIASDAQVHITCSDAL